MYHRRLDTIATFDWAVRAGSTSTDSGLGIASFADGSAVVTGSVSGIASFGAAGSLTSAGVDDIFVAKVNSTGGWEWAVRAGGHQQ